MALTAFIRVTGRLPPDVRRASPSGQDLFSRAIRPRRQGEPILQVDNLVAAPRKEPAALRHRVLIGGQMAPVVGCDHECWRSQAGTS
jgi:hypothetical protein